MKLIRFACLQIALPVFLASAYLLSESAVAQPRPCEEDVKKFCPEAKPGGGGVRRCLLQHFDQLSPGCQEQMSRGRARRYPPRLHGCEADLDKFCKGTPPGGGRLLRCLRDHEAELSEECKKQLASQRGAGRWGLRDPGGAARKPGDSAKGGDGRAPHNGTPKPE